MVSRFWAYRHQRACKMKIAFQGEIGAFSEEAVRALYGDVEPLPLVSFDAVFEAVESGLVDRGVIPIENSLFGSVHVNYDLLRTHNLKIVKEYHLRIRHNLMSHAGLPLEGIKKIVSHPQALGQCQLFLKSTCEHAEVVPVYDTAGAAKMVSQSEIGEGMAAIASVRAAEEYGLSILARGIESNHQNYTRFLALARPGTRGTEVKMGEGIKTSILYAIRENVPGALFKSLAVFALRDLDLYKIESRPLIGSPGKYVFYLDLEGHALEEPVSRALEHLAEVADEVNVLGSYKQAILKTTNNESTE